MTKIQIASPNAGKLAQYIDFPVSQHTGLPQIEIPIYTVTQGPISLPIGLSYHAGGLKVMEPSSWVGTGWSLNAGGMITRSAQGLLDEKKWNSNHSFMRENGYQNYFDYPVENGDTNLNWGQFADGLLDGEPDLFFFNFGNYSGKFYIREDHTPVIIPHQDIKIEPKFCTNPTAQNCNEAYDYLRSFIITTPDGVKYYFGLQEGTIIGSQAVEKIYPYTSATGTQSPQSVSSWYLYKIQSADLESTVTLEYADESYSYPTLAMGGSKPMNDTDPFSTSCRLIRNTMSGVRLTRISFANGQLDFYPSAQPREDLSNPSWTISDGANTNSFSLGEIKISGAGSVLNKVYTFGYSYFNDVSTGLPPNFNCSGITLSSDRKRLKLNSIQEKSYDNSIVMPAWQFSYYDETLVPRRINNGIDHWGYYNGASSNSTMVPKLSADNGATYINSSNYANRESSWPEMRYGALQKMTYPTGGFSEFEYGTDIITTLEQKLTRWDYTLKTSNTCFCDFSSPYVAKYCPNNYQYQYEFTTTASKKFKALISPQNGGGAAFYIINKATGFVVKDFLSTASPFEEIFDLPAGSYGIRSLSYSGTSAGKGGRIDFYEGTPVYEMVSTDHRIGGLRIDKIAHKEVPGDPVLQTTYEYPAGVMLFSIPEYIRLFQTESIRVLKGHGGPAIQFSTNGCLVINNSYHYLVSAGSIVPMRTTQGSHRGYEYVRVRQSGKGYTDYQYDITGASALPPGDITIRKIDSNVCPEAFNDFPEAPLPNDFRRGSLLKKTVYNETNNALQVTTFDPKFVEDKFGVIGYRAFRYIYAHVEDKDLSAIAPRSYMLKSGRKVSETTVEKNYSQNFSDYTSTTTVTEYGSKHNFPVKTSVYAGTSATGTPISKTLYQYLKDVTPCSQDCAQWETILQNSLNAAFSNYQSNQLVTCGSGGTHAARQALRGCSPLYNADVPNNINDCYICAYTNYLLEVNDAYKTYIQNLITYCASDVEKTCLEAAYASASLVLDDIITLDLQNKINMPLEVTSIKNGNVLLSEYKEFGRDFSGSSTKIFPKRTVNFNPATPLAETSFSSIQNTGSDVSRYVGYNSFNEEEYVFNAGHLSELKRRDGSIVSFIWGYNNSVPIVKAVGVDYNALRTAYNATPTDLRNNALVSSAQITTYQYDPLAGIVSITDPNNRAQSFTYDVVGRLLLIKDADGNIVEQYEYRYKN